MKIGLSSWTYGWAIGINGFEKPRNPMNLFDLLEKAIYLNVDVLQVADNLPLANYSPSEIHDFAKTARKKGIEIEAGTKGLDSDNLLRYLEIAENTGAKLVRTLPHDGSDRPDFNEAKKRIEFILPEFERKNIILAIENHDFYKTIWFKEIMEYFKSDNLGICLDTVNSLGQGEGYNEVIDTLGKYTVNFHCKDYIIKRKPSMLGFDISGAPAGYGMLNLMKAKETLRNDITWIIELWTPFTENIVSTISLESDWAEKSVSALKKIQAT
ncbi:MAG: sugar phosphate isomerase/epimerase family protein [Eubacteriales bacterium]